MAGVNSDGIVNRAQGCLLGQLAGDALGSLVEFETPQAIHRMYPCGVRDLADGGTWDTLAGQPTDDSELALMLARTLVEHGRYDRDAARRAYVWWLESGPFDCGNTIAAGLTGPPNTESQANGALMRISPLGIFGTHHDPMRGHEMGSSGCVDHASARTCAAKRTRCLRRRLRTRSALAAAPDETLQMRFAAACCQQSSVEPTLAGRHHGRRAIAPRRLRPSTGLGADRVPQRHVATAERGQHGRRRCGYGDARR